MYQSVLLSQGLGDVKKNIISAFEESIERIFEMTTEDCSNRDIELAIWDGLLESARMTMSVALGLLCCRVTEDDIKVRGLTDDQVRLRNDKDYRYTMMTTFGPVPFFSFAYRDSSSGVATVTRTPAREQVFPLHKHCHSSQLCLEWETKLGQEMPFRRAQKDMGFFTHDAVSLEDTTIERHMVIISRLVDRQWLYQTAETIREVLLHRATHDLKTGKPLLYLSTDAHALRQFVDETWDARWKMANGLRVWCIDRKDGRIIHLGGEYTWGDCHRVGEIVDWLISTGRVPADGDYGQGLVATVVLPTDGMPWFEDYVISKFSKDAVAILDAHHAVLHLKAYTAERFGKNTPEERKFCRETLWLLFGKPQEKQAKPRKNRRGNQGAGKSPRPRTSRRVLSWEVYELAPASVDILIDRVLFDPDVPPEAVDAQVNFIDYLENNTYRMNYLLYRSRGYQLGSGAMESLHRSASQIRLKLPGLKSLPETSQAIFNLRMLELNGRWDEFFEQSDFYDQLVEVFSRKPEPSEEVTAAVISIAPEPADDALGEAA